MSLRLSGGRRLLSPAGASTRPTTARVRQAVMNLLAADLPGSHWLDLCCGSGVMACEALQRGAALVVAIERDRRTAAVARRNLEAVAASLRRSGPPPELRVIQADALRWLARSPAAEPAARSRPSPLSHPASRAAEAASATGAAAGADAAAAATTMAVATTVAAAASAAAAPQEGAGPAAAASSSGGEVASLESAERTCNGPAAAAPSAPVAEPQRFDLVYLDPPWPAGLHARLSEAVLRGNWIRAGGSLVWECPSNQTPEPPPGWRLRDQRRYGGSTVVILQPL